MGKRETCKIDQGPSAPSTLFCRKGGAIQARDMERTHPGGTNFLDLQPSAPAHPSALTHVHDQPLSWVICFNFSPPFGLLPTPLLPWPWLTQARCACPADGVCDCTGPAAPMGWFPSGWVSDDRWRPVLISAGDRKWLIRILHCPNELGPFPLINPLRHCGKHL